MVDVPTTQDKPSGEIVAENVSAEEFMEKYAEYHHEWVKGVVIKMSPVSFQHDQEVSYLRRLLEAYFSLNPIATLVGDPFLMIIESVDSKREPDLQIILKTNPGQITNTAMIGPADICIEVVSPGSVVADYEEKLDEYESGGVQEYWIVNPMRRKCRFHRLQADIKTYAIIPTDTDENYTTPLLPGLKLHVPTLWQVPLPDYYKIAELVRNMLKKGDT